MKIIMNVKNNHVYCFMRRPYDAKNPFMAPIRVHRELHKGGDRSCMHIELDITGSKIRYEDILCKYMYIVSFNFVNFLYYYFQLTVIVSLYFREGHWVFSNL